LRRKSWTKKTTARIGHAEETLAVYLQRTSIKDNLSQRPPFDHIADPIYRRLMRDFIQGAQNARSQDCRFARFKRPYQVARRKRHQLQHHRRPAAFLVLFTTVLLALHREKLVTDRCITVEAWDYFRPFIEKLGDPQTAARTLLARTIRYEIYYHIDLEGLLHYMVTFNTAQRRMSLQVQLEIMRNRDRRN